MVFVLFGVMWCMLCVLFDMSRSAVTHSDEEDSAESTTDEENVEDNSSVDSAEDKFVLMNSCNLVATV